MLKLIRKVKNVLAYLINERCTVVNNKDEEIDELLRARVIENKCMGVAFGLIFGTGIVLAVTSVPFILATVLFTAVFSLAILITLAGCQIMNDAIIENRSI